MSSVLFPDPETLDAYRRSLTTSVVGCAITYVETVGSTNDLARSAGQVGEPEGTVILADQQIAGRGRLGRSWTSPPGANVLMSLLLRPSWLPPTDSFVLTMLASVSLCEAVEQVTPLRAGLKWPNDLMLPNPAQAGAFGKAAGILSELEVDRDRIVWVIVGIGVNVNWTPEGALDGRDLSLTATSLSAAVGHPVDRLLLLRLLLDRLDQRYLDLRRGYRQELFEAWRNRLVMLQQAVQVRLTQGDLLQGFAEGVEPSGALLVRDDRGNLHTVTAGDVGG